MARQRMIKPEFFLHDELAELSPLHRLLFIGLWTLADREGRLEDRPKRIKVEVLPWDDVDVEKALADLDAGGFIHRYEAEGRRYIDLPSFLRHQRPHPKEAPSTIPQPPSREEVMASRERARASREEVEPSREKVLPDVTPRNIKGREKVLPSREKDMASQSESESESGSSGSSESGSSESEGAGGPAPSSAPAGARFCKPRPPGPSNDALFGPGNSLQDALEQRWLEARGSPYAWDELRDGRATRRILQLAGDDVREVLRRWDNALGMRFPRPTSVADLAKHWNAYAAPEESQGSPKRAADVPRAAPAPEGKCSVCPEPSGADVWGQRLCNAHGVELMDSMGTSPSSNAAARWVGDRKRGAA